MLYYGIIKGRVGQKTRGLTCENRLRQIDVFTCMNFEWLIRRKNAIFVDLGFGRYPTTTIETYRKLSAINPEIRVVGVEIDTERLLSAKQYEQTNVEFRLGGFNIPLIKGESATIIRCYNVLRQYPEEEFTEYIETMGNYLMEGGVIIEGTSDQFGRLVSFNLYNKSKGKLSKQGLVFGTNFNISFYPRDFQSVLPKNFLHHVVHGDWICQFFDDWTESFYKTMKLKLQSQRQIFYETAIILYKDYSYNIEHGKRLLRRGFLVVK
jgi:hypothetical protein